MNNTMITDTLEVPPVFSDLGKIAAKLAFYNFEWRYITLVMVQTAQLLIPLESFLIDYKQSLYLKIGKFIPYKHHIQQFVIFGRDAQDVMGVIRWLNRYNYDNSGKYIIICSAANFNLCDEKEVFKVLSKVNMVNVVYLRGVNEDTTLSFSYDKVIPGKCANDVPQMQNIHIGCADDQCFQSIFSAKFRNLYECPFVVSTFEQPPFMYLHNGTRPPSGEDGSIVTLLASVLNASLVIKTPENGNDWGHFENNNWTGSLGDVFNNRVDVSVCSLPLTANKNGNFQISFVYNSMDIVWSARLPLLQPAWEKLLRPFKMFIRVLLLVVFMSIVFLNSFIKSSIWKRIRKFFNIGPPKSNLLFYSWALFVGIPIIRVPSNNHILGIVCTWIWFCFIIRSCYQAALMSSLKSHTYDDTLHSFKKVLQNKYPYGGLGTMREYYADDEHVYKNWVMLNFEEAHKHLDDISNGTTDFVLAYNKEIIIDYLMKGNGSRKLQIIPEKIVNSPTVMYFKKHSPLVARVNQILSGCIEAGLTQLIQRRIESYKKYFFRHLDEHEKQPLTFEHIAGCMYLIVFGWSLSIIFFIVEVYCGKFKDTSERNPF